MHGSDPVVCAFEDTTVSRHALRAAASLSRGLGAPLVLAHVFDPMGVPAHPRREMVAAEMDEQDLERAARRRAQRLLEDAAAGVVELEPATELAEGQPVPGLLDVAAEKRASVLVTGTASRTGMDRILIGSVASELAAAAPCPLVAVTRGAALDEQGPVLAGYDGSPHSLRAARHAAALAARLARDLVLLHVADGDERVDVGPDLAEELHSAAVRGLGDEASRPPLDLKVSVAVEEGDPTEILSAVARERSAAMVITGTRGRGAIGSMLLGSVSAGLVRAAGRPVGLVPASAGETPS